MGLIQLISKKRLTKRMTELTTQIARRSEADVWDRVSEHVLLMTLPEARGFIRARAAKVIYDRTERSLLEHQGLDRSLAPKIIERATETVINLVMSIVRQRKLSTPLVLRRAA